MFTIRVEFLGGAVNHFATVFSATRLHHMRNQLYLSYIYLSSYIHLIRAFPSQLLDSRAAENVSTARRLKRSCYILERGLKTSKQVSPEPYLVAG